MRTFRFFNRVEVDVFGEVEELLIVKNFDTFKSALEKSAGMMVLLLKIHSVGNGQFFE